MLSNNKEESILSFKDVDDLLSLQVLKMGKVPFLGIYNRKKEKNKPVRFSWVEDSARVLKIKSARGQHREYPMDKLEPIIQDLAGDLSSHFSFRFLCLKSTIFLQDIALDPKIITNKKDFALLPETKRSSLWLSDISEGKDDAAFLPCFDVAEKEIEFFEKNGDELYVESLSPEDYKDIRKSGVIRRLVSIDPDRWYMPFQIASFAMALGFSGIGRDCSSLTAYLWDALESNSLNRLSEDVEPEALTQALNLSKHLVSYVRHFPYLNDINYEEQYDAYEVLSKMGYERRRRFDVQPGLISEVSYSVTLYELDDDKVALGFKGSGRTPLHDGDIILSMSKSSYDRALKADSCWSSPDEILTIVNLTKALRTQKWCMRVEKLLSKGLIGNS